MIQTVAETPRLIIRNWTKDDIEPYAAIIGDPEVMRFIGYGDAKPISEAVAAVEKYNRQIEQNGWARFALELKETKELIGFCGYDHYNNELDFGWRLGKKHWGKGYATEAAKEVFRLGVEEFQFPRIVCISFAENHASINVIKKLGFHFEKEFDFMGRGSVVQYSFEKCVELH